MKTDPILQALAGTYSLLNTTYYKLGNPTTPSSYQTLQKGILVYSPWGYVSANIVSTDPAKRPLNVTAPPNLTGSEHDWALLGQYSLSYSGPLQLDGNSTNTERRGRVLHGPVVVSNIPSLEGGTMPREYLVFEREGDSFLSLSFANNVTRAEILWRRVL
ncbi:hypothetical protein QBC47DRAFT_465072 [Echria macrotheca]|uniref:Lipocalin-like domain-containing protein n=1 Tax=Echria macrotheca TaxID=438768 RepID=A0AAJ0B285_9PEZI|nr:hypothetical protein QBC47DRAFT_465072 [Echria macrotheca]